MRSLTQEMTTRCAIEETKTRMEDILRQDIEKQIDSGKMKAVDDIIKKNQEDIKETVIFIDKKITEMKHAAGDKQE